MFPGRRVRILPPMSEASQPIPILVVSGEVEAGEAVKADLAVTTNGTNDIPFQERSLRVGMKLGTPEPREEWKQAMEQASALALLVRHVDVLSLDRIREIYTLMFEELGKPFSVMILRNEGESDFKMSCPHCGQKIWVRDSDVNKRGRCPNCKKGFNLPSQIRHLRTNLQLSEDVPVMMVVKGNAASAKIALITLAKKAAVVVDGKPDDKVAKARALHYRRLAMAMLGPVHGTGIYDKKGDSTGDTVLKKLFREIAALGAK